jgi:hypothetical protein
VGNIYHTPVPLEGCGGRRNFARREQRVSATQHHATPSWRIVGGKRRAKGLQVPNNVLSQSDSLMKEWSRSEGEALEKRARRRGKAWHEIFELLIGASLTGSQVRGAPWPDSSRLNVVDHRGCCSRQV